MLDFGIFKIRTDIFLLIVAILLFLLQLFLCFKVKSLKLRLLPLIVLGAMIAVFTILVFLTDDWDSLGFLVLAIWTAIQLIPCGLGWLTWRIAKKIKDKKQS